MAISLTTNVAALNAQRRLANSSAELSQSFTRLSSGLRVNRASDDAAGLAVSSLLNVDARVYHQGIRNLNDGLSYMDVAEGAATELKSILFRIREIATQGSNGTYGNSQRAALDVEVQQLQSEYGRILDSTSFNGTPMLSGPSQIDMQIGYGNVETLSAALGVVRVIGAIGDGTFQANVAYAGSGNPRAVTTVDVNGDGQIDVISTSAPGDCVDVFFGNGNGTFRAATSYRAGDDPYSVVYMDVNGDGKLDLISASSNDDRVNVLVGNGNGTFLANVSYAGGDGPRSAVAADVNGDGILDLMSASTNDGRVNVLFGNGNGTYQANVSYTGANNSMAVVAADINGDGNCDLLATSGYDNRVSVLIGNGNGTFQARNSFSSGTTPGFSLSDVNGDGKLDVLAASTGDQRVNVLLGNGNGTFKAKNVF